jgi:sensor domain CHASE-containing protein
MYLFQSTVVAQRVEKRIMADDVAATIKAPTKQRTCSARLSTTSSTPLPVMQLHTLTTMVKDDLEKQEIGVISSGRRCSFFCMFQSCRRGLMEQIRFAKQYPSIILGSLLLCCILITCGVALSIHFRHVELQSLEQEALTIAEETAFFFSNELDQAILPLFSLAQFVNEIPIFQDLENQVGYIGEPGALPLISETHRNVTGVCDAPELVERFNKIASALKSNANMDGILVNLQLVPDAVACLLYPLNNTQDFPDGMYLDSTGAVGHDLLSDPARKFIAEQTLQDDELIVAGPLTLRQCDGCDPTVKKAFIARLPIKSSNNSTNMTSEKTGRRYGKWGFAVALINWERLVVDSDIYKSFNAGDLEFELTRTDRTYNVNESSFEEDVSTFWLPL